MSSRATESTRKGPVSPVVPGHPLVALRAVLALIALGLAGGSILADRAWRSEQRRLATFLEKAAPLVLPDRLWVEVARESDPLRARLRAARGMFAAELARRPPEVNPGSPAATADAAASARRLTTAADLAATSFAERPAAWEGPLVIGGAIYLGRLRTEDDALIRSYQDWEAPLSAARALAPGRLEPEVLLAHAYTRLWSVLSKEKRRLALPLIRRSLADRNARQDLLPAWLAAAGGSQLAFTAVPDDPDAWSEVRQIYSQQRDWIAMRDARRRFRRALRTRLTSTLEAARGEVRRGNAAGGRELYLSVIARSGEADDGAPLLSHAVDECPAGRADAATAASLARALGWILDRCRFAECPLKGAALARLARLTGEADPNAAALAAVLAGDRELAQSLERKAGLDGGAAAAALKRRSAEDLAARSAEAWPAGGWTSSNDRERRELVASRSAPGLAIEIDEVATGAAVVEIRADGGFVGTFVATPGTPLLPAFPVAPGLHLLEVTAINGGPVSPGAVRLAAQPGGSGGS